jgi:hypothetical protein
VSAAVALRDPGQAHARLSLFDHVADAEPTLEDLIASVWEGLGVPGEAPCPVCGNGPMVAERQAGAGRVRGRCTSCGSALS